MTKKGQEFGFFGKVFGKKIRVENCTFLGKYLKKGHREFGVPGNVILQKGPADVSRLKPS